MMTVEDLLKQLETKRRKMMTTALSFGSRAYEAMIHKEKDDAEFYTDLHDRYMDNIKRLDITIEEIKKRVS